MTTLTIKNIPDTLYQVLKDQAALHRRSLNSEVIVNLEQAVAGQKTNVQVVLKEARRLREKSSHYKLTTKILKTAKEQGRL